MCLLLSLYCSGRRRLSIHHAGIVFSQTNTLNSFKNYYANTLQQIYERTADFEGNLYALNRRLSVVTLFPLSLSILLHQDFRKLCPKEKIYIQNKVIYSFCFFFKTVLRLTSSAPLTRVISVSSLSLVSTYEILLTSSISADFPELLTRQVHPNTRQQWPPVTQSWRTPSQPPPGTISWSETAPRRFPLFRLCQCLLLQNYKLEHYFLCCFSHNPHLVPPAQHGRHRKMEYSSFIRCVLKIKTV